MREHHWPPETIGRLFFDAIDYNGLEYWYNDIIKVNKELTDKQNNK